MIWMLLLGLPLEHFNHHLDKNIFKTRITLWNKGFLGSSSIGSAFDRASAIKQPRIRNGFTSPFGLYRTSSPSRFSELALRPSPQPHQAPAPLHHQQQQQQQQQQQSQQQVPLDYATSDTLRALHRLDPLELVARVESKRSRLRATRERLDREEGQVADAGTGTVGAVMVGTEPGGRVVVMGVGEEWRSSPTISRIQAASGSGALSEENRTPLPE